MTQRLSVLLAGLFVFLLAPVAQSLPLWELEGTRNSIRLLGSVHFLRAEDYPLPDTQRPTLASSQGSAAFPPGSKVAIVGGPLVGNAGTVVLDCGKTVKVAVAIFGRETEVDLEADDLELDE